MDKEFLTNGDDDEVQLPKKDIELSKEDQALLEAFMHYRPINQMCMYVSEEFMEQFDKAMKEKLKRYGISNN